MTAAKSRFRHHLFVCVGKRPPGGKPSCGGRGGDALYTALQEQLGQREALWGEVTITSTNCLGPCFEGPNMVVYPDGAWYAGVQAEDAKEIFDSHVQGGVPVERLRYQWPTDDD
jgi:(2Fe-2S) ferredoxin